MNSLLVVSAHASTDCNPFATKATFHQKLHELLCIAHRRDIVVSGDMVSLNSISVCSAIMLAPTCSGFHRYLMALFIQNKMHEKWRRINYEIRS